MDSDFINSDSSISPSSDGLLTRKQVAHLLQMNPHVLSTRRKELEEILPIIRIKGSKLTRYRKSDVMRLIEGGCMPASSKDSEGGDNA